MKHDSLSVTRQIDASQEQVYEAWTQLEHRRHWFAGPGWTEIKRSLDLRPGGSEVAHGRFENGTETIYTSHFHLIEPNARLIYAFDMQVNGKPFSVSLAGVELSAKSGMTELTYTEAGFFLDEQYGIEGRTQGTNWLLDQFVAYLKSLR